MEASAKYDPHDRYARYNIEFVIDIVASRGKGGKTTDSNSMLDVNYFH